MYQVACMHYIVILYLCNIISEHLSRAIILYYCYSYDFERNIG